MNSMLVTQQNIVEVAKQCRGHIRASDADGSHGAVFVQIDALKLGHDRDTRAYLGDTIVERDDTFEVVRRSSQAA